ncbi:hypothetical protein NHF46_10065 [Arthrobacter alpinus]|nr:hypothetical protein [Arthrobacter alpinus]
MKYENNDSGFRAFCEAATIALEREVGSLQGKLIESLHSLESRWHPNGFAVFHIDDDHALGNLRLHIWPDGPRVARSDDAPIHTHVWHLCSRILAGNYRETIYAESGEDSMGGKEYHSASIDYLLDKDAFRASSKRVLSPKITTLDSAGSFHLVPADVPHETHIDDGSFVATMLIASNPVTEKAVMYSPKEIRSSTYDRPVLTSDEKWSLLSRLEREMKFNQGESNC